GLGGNDTFNVGAWTTGGTIYGGEGVDRVVDARDAASFVLRDDSLQSTGAAPLSLVGAEAATLTGGASSNAFNLSGWTGSASIAGGGAPSGSVDAVNLTRDANFSIVQFAVGQYTLGVTSGTTTQSITLSTIGAVNLTGGAGANTFTVSGYVGAG